jgi:RNA polymerase sigma-70 factor (ECF subfamily)
MNKGQATDWDELVSEFYTPIYRFCRQFLGNQAEAEDATQQVFFKAWKKSSTLKDQSATRAWLYTIARNVCRDRVRWWKRLFAFTETLELPEVSAPNAISRTLRRAVANLPTRQREVFILRHWHEFSTAETAAQLGISPGAVKAHLKRAVDSLRKQFEHERSTESSAVASISIEGR